MSLLGLARHIAEALRFFASSKLATNANRLHSRSTYNHKPRTNFCVAWKERIGSSKPTKDTRALKIATPQYVLRNESYAFGPNMTKSSSKLIYKSIFGFSDKPFYDKFSDESQIPLTPYPLVKGYLKNQITAVIDELLNLIIVDATGPAADVVYAATMDSILVAHESGDKQILATHLLRFDPKVNAYGLEAIPA